MNCVSHIDLFLFSDQALSGDSSDIKERLENDADPLEDEAETFSPHGILTARGGHELEVSEVSGLVNMKSENSIERIKHQEVHDAYHENQEGEKEQRLDSHGDAFDKGKRELRSPTRSIPPPPSSEPDRVISPVAISPKRDSLKAFRRSIPPPARALPVPDDGLNDAEPAPPLPPGRRSIPPPPVTTEDNDTEKEHAAATFQPIDTTFVQENNAANSSVTETTKIPPSVVFKPPMISPSQSKHTVKRSVPPPFRALSNEPRKSDLEAYSQDFRGNSSEVQAEVRVVDEPQQEILDEEDGGEISKLI